MSETSSDVRTINEVVDAVRNAGFAPDARRHAFKELVEDLQRGSLNPAELEQERKAFTE
jgi:hypothetical protein